MKYVIVAGGTAGHINPAIALGQELQDRHHDVYFAGTPNRLESRLVPEEGFEFHSFVAYGFNRKKPFSIFKAISSIQKSTKQAKTWLSQIRPNAVIGFGCYVSLSVCRAALQLNIPVIIHEQNSVMGLANKYLSKKADVTCLTYKHADTGKCKKVEITGNPVRQAVINASRSSGRKILGVDNKSRLLVVFGGSLGAEHINKAIINIADNILEVDNNSDLEIVHITGTRDYENVLDSLSEKLANNSSYHVLSYSNQMGEVLAASDYVISRAGASSLAEISALQVPALLIPYPLATENHQYLNAMDMVNKGCSMLLDDSSVNTEAFQQAVSTLINDTDVLTSMKHSLSQLNAKNSVKKIADIVESF